MRRPEPALLLTLALFLGCSAATIQVRPERLYQRLPRDGAEWSLVSRLDVGRSGFTLLGIPIASPNLAGAIETEIQRAGADAVTNLEIESRMRSLFILISSRHIARGDLIRFERPEQP